jgi:hypothetical protein
MYTIQRSTMDITRNAELSPHRNTHFSLAAKVLSVAYTRIRYDVVVELELKSNSTM